MLFSVGFGGEPLSWNVIHSRWYYSLLCFSSKFWGGGGGIKYMVTGEVSTWSCSAFLDIVIHPNIPKNSVSVSRYVNISGKFTSNCAQGAVCYLLVRAASVCAG